jgi:hypothetical protein
MSRQALDDEGGRRRRDEVEETQRIADPKSIPPKSDSVWYNKSKGGGIFRELEGIGRERGLPVDVKGAGSACETFTLGEDYAYLVKHVENDGSTGFYVRTRDMQKPWWKQCLEAAGLPNSRLHMIDMRIFEALDGVDPEGARKFFSTELAGTIGVGDSIKEQMLGALAEEVRPLVAPHYRIQYGYGGGDLETAYRLIPANVEVRASELNVNSPYVDVAKRVLENYDSIVDGVKTRLKLPINE